MRLQRLTLSALACLLFTQLPAQKDPKTTEIWSPEPKVVTPGASCNGAPSDAIVLFDGTSGSKWQHKDGTDAKWTVADNAFTVKPGTGDIQSKQKFGDCQLHIEWRVAADVTGDGQNRGNSGVFLMGRYEVQVLDNYNNINKTYVNGQAGSIYKQYPPLVNACKAPGEWQTYDIIFTAPRFSENGSVINPARLTVLQNGVLVQNKSTLWGNTVYIGSPAYEKHEAKEPITLQDHGNMTSFRNIWIREL
ncbi:MAG: DUF1080 domain-containing protein [Chitinophagaceae bacterium]